MPCRITRNGMAAVSKGLAGENIPLWGRICAVADVFDALASKRPYKEAFSNEKSLEIMKENGVRILTQTC